MPKADPVDHDGLIRILFGASAFQLLNAGCELGLFARLGEAGPLTAEQIAVGLKLQPRAAEILLLGTTSLGLTVREGDHYTNAELIASMIADDSWSIIEDIVRFEDRITIPAAADLAESLRRNTNVGLRSIPGEGDDLYHRLASQPELEALFYRCMRSWSRLSNPILVDRAELGGVSRVLDVGGGDGVNAIALAEANPGTSFTVVDMPGALDIARRRIADRGLEDRISVQAGDIFADAFPGGHDCVLFANQLVIWSPEENATLLRKAYDCLPPDGQVLIFNAFSEDSGDGPLYAALDNVYFATLPAASSTLYRWGQYEEWLRQVGFRRVERLPGGTWTPHGVLRAWK
ncbi:methyltransferase [Kitasatospora sp. NPDC058190]|uniref:methyltransferase n=1 Tax=Kitasatospora sp. NPDC058190 TaxID=3346371 RepID=UPI0036DCE05B